MTARALHTEGHPPCHRCICTTQPFTRGAGHHPRLRGEAGRRLQSGWKTGRDVAYDVMVINCLRQYLIKRVAESPKYALEFSKRQKNQKYLIPCEEGDVVFVPLPIEVFGGWEDEAEREISSLTKALARQQGQEESQVKRHTFQ